MGGAAPGLAACSDVFLFTSLVGHFSPNAFGLFDTDGNAQSWVQDCEDDSDQGASVDGCAWELRGLHRP